MTRDELASVLGLVAPGRVVYPNPRSGSFNDGDRAQAAYSYRGIIPPILVIDNADAEGDNLSSASVAGIDFGVGWSLPGVSLAGRDLGGRGPN